MGRNGTLLVLTLFLLFVVGTPRADATVLQLSTHSSNGSIYTEPQWLDTDLDFTVVGSALTLTVTNTTSDGPDPSQTAFDVREIFFNFGGNVTDLTKSKFPKGWTLTVDPNNIHVNGFGKFDVSLVAGTGNGEHPVTSGQTKSFDFGIVGTGSYSDADFTTHLSELFDGGPEILGLAAGKFVSGGPTGDESAFGMVVPEPATVALLGLGGLFLLRRKK